MAKHKRTTISQRTVDKLSVEKGTVYWDRALQGFGVRVYPTGSKVYVVQFRADGRSKRLTIGRHGVITPNHARRRAARIIARVQSGEPPVPVKTKSPAASTVAELAQRFLSEHVDVRFKPQTVKAVHRLFDKFILPAFGTVPAQALRCEQVTALHERLHRTPRLANYVVEMLSAMFKRAQAWRMVPEETNPCTGVFRYKRPPRERFLTEAEFTRLGRVLSEMEAKGEVSSHAAAAIRLLMLTGCRRNEIVALRWDEVDLEREELRLRDTKSGPRTVPLSPPAIRVLSKRPRVPGNPWVIPGGVDGEYLKYIHDPWCKVRARANLEDVRLHDFRHSFASRALVLGESLPMIGKLLGHARVQTTARYAHLGGDSVKAAAARIAASIGEDIFGTLPATCSLATRNQTGITQHQIDGLFKRSQGANRGVGRADTLIRPTVNFQLARI